MTDDRDEVDPSEPVAPSAHSPSPFDAALTGAPDDGAEPPTVLLPWETSTPPEHAAPATELLGVGQTARADSGAASPIDALFGETQFKDYEGEPLIGATLFRSENVPDDGAVDGATVRVQVGPKRATGGPLPQSQKVLFWVAGGVIAALALVVLFVLGTKLPALLGPAPVVVASRSPLPNPSPSSSVLPAGPVASGIHKWNALRGGECLDPYQSPFAENFTVVDCAAAHPAQMVFRGTFPVTAAAPTVPSTASPSQKPVSTPLSTPAAGGDYPGIDALQAQINLLCTAPGVMNLAVAGGYDDIQLQAAYAVTAAEWASGQHDYYCFVSRSSGEAITGTVAVPRPAS